jgi:DNA-binding MarR family transcriptional regulator
MTTKQPNAHFQYLLQHKYFTPSMARVLQALDTCRDENPDSPVTCKKIATLAGVHASYMSRNTKHLEAAGYIRLERYPDGVLKVPGITILKGWEKVNTPLVKE